MNFLEIFPRMRTVTPEEETVILTQTECFDVYTTTEYNLDVIRFKRYMDNGILAIDSIIYTLVQTSLIGCFCD